MKRLFTTLDTGIQHARTYLRKSRCTNQERVPENESIFKEYQATIQDSTDSPRHNSQDTSHLAESSRSTKLSKIFRQMFSQAYPSQLSFPLMKTSPKEKTPMEITKEKLLLHYSVKNKFWKALQKHYTFPVFYQSFLTKEELRKIWIMFLSPLGVYKFSPQNFEMSLEDIDVMMSLISSYYKGDIINSTTFLQNLIGNPDYFRLFKKAINSRGFSGIASDKEFYN